MSSTSVRIASVRLAEGFAARMGAPAPYARLTARLLARAAGTGDPGRDFARLFPEFDGFAGEEP